MYHLIQYQTKSSNIEAQVPGQNYPYEYSVHEFTSYVRTLGLALAHGRRG
jgi:hypothetical protein